jgi:hypothetical protein
MTRQIAGPSTRDAEDHPVVRKLGMKPRIFSPPEWLADAMRTWSDPETRRYLTPLSPEQRQIAADAASAWDRYLGITITGAALDEWAEPLLTAVERTPDEAVYRGRLSGVLLAVPDMPGIVLNDFTQRAALREFSYFPSVAKIVALLETERGRLSSIRRAVRALADPPQDTIPQPRKAPTPEEVEAVDRMLTEWGGKRTLSEPPPIPPRPAYAEGDALRAMRERGGGGGLRSIALVVPALRPVRAEMAQTIDAETAAATGEGTTTPPEGDSHRDHADHEGQQDRGC